MFSALSFNHGDLQNKLDVFIACAPIINLTHSTNGMMLDIKDRWSTIESTANHFGYYAVSHTPFDMPGMKTFCKIFKSFCTNITKENKGEAT